MRLAHIMRPNSSRQAVDAVVGDGQNFIYIFKRKRRHHGSKNFFLNHFHILTRVDQYGWLDEVSFSSLSAATNHGLGAFGKSGVNVAAHAIELLFGD